MNRERETERTAGRDSSAEDRNDDPSPAKPREDEDTEHRFHDWALI